MDRQGFARASLTAKKRAVPSPATTSTEHRSTQKSVCLIPLCPLSAGLESSLNSVKSIHIHTEREREDGVKRKTVGERQMERKVEG